MLSSLAQKLGQGHFSVSDPTTRNITTNVLNDVNFSSTNTPTEFEVSLFDTLTTGDVIELSVDQISTNWRMEPFILSDDISIPVTVVALPASIGMPLAQMNNTSAPDDVLKIEYPTLPFENGTTLAGPAGTNAQNAFGYVGFVESHIQVQTTEILMSAGTNIGDQAGALQLIVDGINQLSSLVSSSNQTWINYYTANQFYVYEDWQEFPLQSNDGTYNAYGGLAVPLGNFGAFQDQSPNLSEVVVGANGKLALKLAGFNPLNVGCYYFTGDDAYSVTTGFPQVINGVYWMIFIDLIDEIPFTLYSADPNLAETFMDFAITTPSTTLQAFSRVVGLPGDILYPYEFVSLELTGNSTLQEFTVLTNWWLTTPYSLSSNQTSSLPSWASDFVINFWNPYPSTNTRTYSYGNDSFPVYSSLSSQPGAVWLGSNAYVKNNFINVIAPFVVTISYIDELSKFTQSPAIRQNNIQNVDYWANSENQSLMPSFLRGSVTLAGIQFDAASVFFYRVYYDPYNNPLTFYSASGANFPIFSDGDYFLDNKLLTVTMDLSDDFNAFGGSLVDGMEGTDCQTVVSIISNPFGAIQTNYAIWPSTETILIAQEEFLFPFNMWSSSDSSDTPSYQVVNMTLSGATMKSFSGPTSYSAPVEFMPIFWNKNQYEQKMKLMLRVNKSATSKMKFFLTNENGEQPLSIKALPQANPTTIISLSYIVIRNVSNF